MIYRPEITKCDFDPTNQSVRFFVGKDGKKNYKKIKWPPNGRRFGKTIF